MTASRIFSLPLAGRLRLISYEFLTDGNKNTARGSARRAEFLPIENAGFAERYFRREPMPTIPQGETPGSQKRRSGAAAMAQYTAQQFGGIARADLAHDAGAIALDGARAQAKPARGLLVGFADGDPRQHLALAPGE